MRKMAQNEKVFHRRQPTNMVNKHKKILRVTSNQEKANSIHDGIPSNIRLLAKLVKIQQKQMSAWTWRTRNSSTLLRMWSSLTTLRHKMPVWGGSYGYACLTTTLSTPTYISSGSSSQTFWSQNLCPLLKICFYGSYPLQFVVLEIKTA